MSFAAQTWTMDTANTPWVKPDGEVTKLLDTSQTLSFTATDTGDGGIYFGAPAQSFKLIDGTTVKVNGDKSMTCLWAEKDGASVNNGSIWVSHDDDVWKEVIVRTMTVTNADGVGANNLANITFEYKGTPYTWSWTNVNTA